MTRLPILLALAAALLHPAPASALPLDRGAFGHGTLTVSNGPACTTPPATPSNQFSSCGAIEATAFDACTITTADGFRDRICTLRLTAEPAAGWIFQGWTADTSQCPNSGQATCQVRTFEERCVIATEECTSRALGPFQARARFANVRAPVTQIAGPAEDSLAFDAQGRQTFAFSTQEDHEAPAFQCRLDDGAFAPCTTPHTRTGLADGIHRLCVKARDASGLEGPTTCRSWQQERPPTVTLTAAPSALTARRDAAFAYTSNKAGHVDDGSVVRFECRLDAAAFGPCPATGTALAGLRDGLHEFAVRAVFGAGIEGPASRHLSAPAIHRWIVDTTPPETTITAGPAEAATIVDVAPTFAFAASEVASFRCRVDGGPAQPCGSPFTTPALAAGAHAVAVTATDAAGNADPTPAVRSFTLVTGLATLVDADRDGFPQGLDCDDADAIVRPGTAERPGNRVDENCDGTAAPFPRVTAIISASGSSNARVTTLTRLAVTGVPAGGRVELRCKGPKRACPFARRSIRVRNGKANGLRGRRGLRFGVGATIEVRVTAPDMIGRVRRLRVVRRAFPRGQDLCLAPGAAKPAKC